MKNILLITNGFPFGDSERGFLQAEFEELVKFFHVYILACDNKSQLIYMLPNEVQCEKYIIKSKARAVPCMLFHLKKQIVRQEIKMACKVKSPQKKILRFLKILLSYERSRTVKKQIEAIVVKHNIDLVYTYWCTEATIAALQLKKQYPLLKVITRFHGYDLYQERAVAGWQVSRPYIAKYCDKMVFVSEDGRQYFVNHWGYAEKAFVSYIGTHSRMQNATRRDDSLVIVSCSSLIPLKRVDLIIKALQLLPEEQRVEWHHYGDGKLEEELKETAKKVSRNHLNQRYIFHGKIANEKIEGEYHKIGAQLFITTSASEGLPVSMMEAISMGIPAIGTSVNGIPELIEDGKSGFLLPRNPTPIQIANCIMKYVYLPYHEKERMANAARNRWEEKFDAKKCAEKFCRMIDTM